MQYEKGGRKGIWPLLGLMAAFCAIWFFFYPAYISSSDEGIYFRDAIHFIRGAQNYTKIDLPTWQRSPHELSGLLPGHPALLAVNLSLSPWWKTIFLNSLLAAMAATALLALILRRNGVSPLFASLLLSYPVTIILARTSMNDMPNLALVLGSLACFWLWNSKPWGLFLAGLLAGLSLAFRETNVLILAPFFLGHLIRRRPGGLHLIAGGLLGLCPRLLYLWINFGSPFYFPPIHQAFGGGRFWEHVVFYGLSLNMILPGIPLLAVFYRGKHRAELFSACLVFFVFYCWFEGGAHNTALGKRLIVANRYMLPLAAILVIAAADVLQRWRDRVSPSWARGVAIGYFVLAVGLWGGLMQMHGRWLGWRAQTRQIIYQSTSPNSVILHNNVHVRKYLLPVGSPRDEYSFLKDTQGTSILNALTHHREVFVVLILRRGRGWFNECALEFLERVRQSCRVEEVKRAQLGSETLLINRVQSCRNPLLATARPDCLGGEPPPDWEPEDRWQNVMDLLPSKADNGTKHK